MKKKMIPLLLLLPLLFLLAVYGKDSKKEEVRVVVIAIDGLRWQEVFEGAKRDSLMPFLWEMGRKKGCMIGNRNRKSKMEVANGIWKSYAGYSEMLCGVTDDEHIFDNRKQYNPNRSVLELAEACSEYKDRVNAVASWDVVPYILNYRRSELPVDFRSRHRVSKQVRNDSVTLNRALKTLKEKHPKLLFVEFCETDYYGHHGKWLEYLNAAHQNDQFIRQLWECCQQDPYYLRSWQGRESGRSCQQRRSRFQSFLDRTWQKNQGQQPNLAGGIRKGHPASGRNGRGQNHLHQAGGSYHRQHPEGSVYE